MGGAIQMKTILRERGNPNLIVHNVDRCTLESQIRPEDMFSRFRCNTGGSMVDVGSIEGWWTVLRCPARESKFVRGRCALKLQIEPDTDSSTSAESSSSVPRVPWTVRLS